MGRTVDRRAGSQPESSRSATIFCRSRNDPEPTSPSFSGERVACISNGLDPFDALGHAREVRLELGETAAHGGEPLVRGGLVDGTGDRDRETSIRDGQGLLPGGRFGVRRRLWLALLVGAGRLRFVATELRLDVGDYEDLLLVFAHPFSLSVSAAAVFPSLLRVMLCHSVLADQPTFRLRFSDGANPRPPVRDPGESPTPFASS